MKKRKIAFLISIFLLILCLGIAVYAAVTITSTRGKLEVTSTSISIDTAYTSSGVEIQPWVYTKTGDSKDVEVKVTNSSEVNIHRYYQVTLNEQLDNKLASAILVYYNGEFIDTLAELVKDNTEYINDQYALISNGKYATDTISFKLHQSAPNSIFQGKTISIKLTTYSENMDYSNFIIVENKAEFYKAIDDVNSGLLTTTPTIFLANTMTLDSNITIKNPVVIHTNGKTLSGSITLSGEKALITVLGTGSITSINTVTSGNYYKAGALKLVTDYAKSVLKNGLKSETSIDVVGPYSFYNFIIAENSDNLTLNGSTITAVKKNYSSLETISIGTEKINFNLIGAKTDFSETTVLAHLPTDNEIITTDLFLPTFVPDCDATIEWTSSNPDVLSHEGKISNNNFDNESVVLTARIKINNKVYTRVYSFKITANNNLVNFQKLVKDISPLIIKKKDEFYYLPIVTEVSGTSFGNYDYRTDYTSPAEDPTINWIAHEDIGLESITYAKYYDGTVENPIDTYDYIEVSDNGVKLSKDTVSNYAKILITGRFSSGEEYESIINVSISIGSDTELLEKTFNYVNNMNDNISVLGNIISTRKQYGIINEKGDFTLPGQYGKDYTIDYAITHASDKNVLSCIKKYIATTDTTAQDGKQYYKAQETTTVVGETDVTGYYVLVDGVYVATADTTAKDGTTYYQLTLASIKTGESVSNYYECIYEFKVNPVYFKSVVTDIPVTVTVTYHKTDGNLAKSKIMYVTMPAAIHKAEVGNISIFNSLKYQVIQALPSRELKNSGYSIEGTKATYSGYDYILLRDIVGDSEYVNNYEANDYYLQMNQIELDKNTAASGVRTIKLYNLRANDNSTTDTLAYDFINLIQWAVGDEVKTASFVLSDAGKAKINDTLENYKSNGETYLTIDELAVIEAFYKTCTNDNGTKWDEIKQQVLEEAPGRIYDNATLLETILYCLTTEKGVDSGWYENQQNGTYGKIYAKYLEIVNRYAITTSENEEPMSPAQEVYNSKYYYSFTENKAHSSTSGITVSIPCKYYNASGVLVDGYCNRYQETEWLGKTSGKRQGTYASKTKKGNPAVDLYAQEVDSDPSTDDGPYDSDKTKYITSAELMVIKAFWLGALDNLGQASVLTSFNDASKIKIRAALGVNTDGTQDSTNSSVYPNYNFNNFDTYGEAILNAFDACLTIPTTFTSNGIGLLINSFYDNFNQTGYQIRQYGNSEDTTTFISTLVQSVPAVTNLDNLEGALSYFSNLQTIEIVGNTSLSLFLSDYGLSTSFARLCLTNKKVTSLKMNYVSPKWNNFDIKNIKNLDILKTIDISNNQGIKSVNALLNVNRLNYTSVNFANIGEVFEYNEFVIDNLASNSCSVTFTNSNHGEETKNTGNPSTLVNISDIEDLVSEHLYLTNVIYDETANTDICWRIEEGNEINDKEINQGGELDKIDNVNAMNMRLSPYFYCETGFTYDGIDFEAKHLYKITYYYDEISKLEQISVEDINSDKYSIDIIKQASDLEDRVLDLNGNVINDNLGEEVNIQNNDEFDRISEPVKTATEPIYVQNFKDERNTTYKISMHYQVFSFQANKEFEDDGQTKSSQKKTYYLRANGNELKADDMTNNEGVTLVDASCYMVILTEQEATFIDKLNQNGNEISDNDMDSYGIVPNGENVTLGIENLNSNVDTCYIYNIKEKKFMYSGGFDTKLGDKFKISISSSKYLIYNKTSTQYLDCFKQLIIDQGKGSNVISAVFNTNSSKSDDLTNERSSHCKLYNSKWTLYTSVTGYYELVDGNYVATNDPTATNDKVYYKLTQVSVSTGDSVTGYYELVDGNYVATNDPTATNDKVYYKLTQVSVSTGDSVTGYYELVDGKYVATEDTKAQYGKAYYKITLITTSAGATSTIGNGEYSYTASINTPSISIITKEGKRYTASFNCYTIRNARKKDDKSNYDYVHDKGEPTETHGSKGYLYDNGATLLLNASTAAQPTNYSYYFCLMSDEDITTLNAWYQTPNRDITFGREVSREYLSNYQYYIYNPFTRRYATGRFNDSNGLAFYTTPNKPEYPFQLGYRSATDNNGGIGYFISQRGSGKNVYNIDSNIKDQTSFNNADKSNLYYITANNATVTPVGTNSYQANNIYFRKSTTATEGFYLKSWNAYGGIKSSCYGIATYDYDSGSLWVFDKVKEDNKYEYVVQEKSESLTQVAYELTYTINKVSAMVVNNKISRYYEFDKYYYLDNDITIDGNKYKKGNLIRFEYNAYKGKAYQANIVYYEVEFTYTKADGTTDKIVDPSNLSFLYYVLDNKYIATTDTIAQYGKGYYQFTPVSVTTGNSVIGYYELDVDGNYVATDDETATNGNVYYELTQVSVNTGDSVTGYYEKKINGVTGTLTYSPCQAEEFKTYNQGFTITIPGVKNITETYDDIHWIYTTESFNEVKYKLYEDEYGKEKANEFVINKTYYEPIYKVATIFSDTFSARKNNGTLYIDANGNTITTDYDNSTKYYELGYVKVDGNDLNSTQNVGTEENPIDSIFSIFNYYKFDIYSDASGTKIPLNATFDPNGTYYFKHGDEYSTALPTMLNGLDQEVELILNSKTFEFFKNNLWYYNQEGTLIEVTEDSLYNSDIQYYKEAYVISNFRQEILDAYSSVLFINNEGVSVGTDATFNPERIYWTYDFVPITISETDFTNYKSVLYIDANGTPLPENAIFNNNATYYKKNMKESKPGPQSGEEEIWHDEVNITRFCSHVKNMSNESQNELERYKDDVSDVDQTTLSKLHQYLGSDTESENIYSYPTEISYEYELLLPGLVNASNWDKYKATIYYKSGTNYVSCSDKVWSDSYRYVNFYRHILKATENITANVSYEYLAGYRLNKSNSNLFGIENQNILIWDYVAPGVNNTGKTMDEILDEANTHFNDLDYNLWYGKYYGYNGFTMGTTQVVLDENRNDLSEYDKGYIYRIVLNSTNTGFVWQRVKSYSRITGATMVTNASTGVATDGDIVFATTDCFNNFYTGGKFYRVVRDDFTKTLNVIKFADVSISNIKNDAGTDVVLTDIQSEKIRYVSQSDYLGYAGTFEVVISAVKRNTVDGVFNYTDTIKKYKIKFVGTVIR